MPRPIFLPDSSILKNPCSCRGGNPTCFKCGGWGYIDSIGNGRAAPGPATLPISSGKSRKTKKKQTRLLVVCPECKVQTTRLTKHLRKVHGIGQPAQPNPSRAGEKENSGTTVSLPSNAATEEQGPTPSMETKNDR